MSASMLPTIHGKQLLFYLTVGSSQQARVSSDLLYLFYFAEDLSTLTHVAAPHEHYYSRFVDYGKLATQDLPKRTSSLLEIIIIMNQIFFADLAP